MRIIDKYKKSLIILDRLKPARHMGQIFNTLTDKLRVQILGQAPGKCRQDIINVMFPDKPGMDLYLSLRENDFKIDCRLNDR